MKILVGIVHKKGGSLMLDAHRQYALRFPKSNHLKSHSIGLGPMGA